MKKIELILIGFILASCQQSSSNVISSQQIRNPPIISKNCSQNPMKLSADKVKSLTLSNLIQEQRVETNKNQSIGYTFFGKKGRTFKYYLNNKDKDICVWIQTPENKILQTPELLIETPGTYLIQIASLQNYQQFNIELKLALPSPEEFIKQYYQKLNARKYTETWTYLSPRFQKVSESYTDYTQWWNSVAMIRIGKINLVKELENQAIVNVELAYQKKTGRLVEDRKSYVYLIWNETLQSWQINEKKSPSSS